MIRDDRGSGFSSALLLVAVVGLIVATFLMFFGNVQLSSEQAEMPDPDIEFNYTASESGNDELRIRHAEGPRVNPAQFAVRISDASCTGAGDPNGEYAGDEAFGLTEGNWMAPGMVLIVDGTNPVPLCEEGSLELDGATVELVWENPDEEFQTIDNWTA